MPVVAFLNPFAEQIVYSFHFSFSLASLLLPLIMLPAQAATLVQAAPAESSATLQDEPLAALDAQLQQLRQASGADLQQADVEQLRASFSDKFNAFEQLVQQSGREAQYEKKVIAYRSHLLALQAKKGSANASYGRSNTLPSGEVARNQADLAAGRVVCTNPAASTTGRFDRNEPYTDSWMVYVCRAEKVPARR